MRVHHLNCTREVSVFCAHDALEFERLTGRRFDPPESRPQNLVEAR